MRALRYIALVALALWVGGLIVLGSIAAPSIFDVVALRGVADGRLLAGAVFGETLRRFHLLSYGCGGILVGSLMARAILGPRPMRFAVRLGIALLMLAASAYSGLVVSTRIARALTDLRAAPSSLAADDPQRAAFGRLHATSAALQLVPVLGGLMLMFWETKD